MMNDLIFTKNIRQDEKMIHQFYRIFYQNLLEIFRSITRLGKTQIRLIILIVASSLKIKIDIDQFNSFGI